jgi:hypothetical protein
MLSRSPCGTVISNIRYVTVHEFLLSYPADTVILCYLVLWSLWKIKVTLKHETRLRGETKKLHAYQFHSFTPLGKKLIFNYIFHNPAAMNNDRRNFLPCSETLSALLLNFFFINITSTKCLDFIWSSSSREFYVNSSLHCSFFFSSLF